MSEETKSTDKVEHGKFMHKHCEHCWHWCKQCHAYQCCKCGEEAEGVSLTFNSIPLRWLNG
jgi:hypothetical protein